MCILNFRSICGKISFTLCSGRVISPYRRCGVFLFIRGERDRNFFIGFFAILGSYVTSLRQKNFILQTVLVGV